MSLTVKTLSTFLLTPNEPLQHLVNMLLRGIGVTKVIPSNSFQEAVSAYNQWQPDICIIDTSQLPKGKSGIDFASYIREENGGIPFVFLVDSFNDTSYEQVKGVDQSSVLSKDVSRLQLLQALKYSLLQLENSKLARQVSENLYALKKPNNIATSAINDGQMFFKVGDSFRAIGKDEISFFFADNKLSYARVGKRNFPLNVQLKTLEEWLSPTFSRCHRKYLLNESHIESISLKKGKIEINGESLPIGISYRKTFLTGLNLLK